MVLPAIKGDQHHRVGEVVLPNDIVAPIRTQPPRERTAHLRVVLRPEAADPHVRVRHRLPSRLCVIEADVVCAVHTLRYRVVEATRR